MKYELILSRNIIRAVQKVKDAYDLYYQQYGEIVQRHLKLYNDDAKRDILSDKEFLDDIVHEDLRDEVTELIRAILEKKEYFAGNPYEYMFPMNGINKPSEDEINFIKQRNEELKKLYSYVGNECDTAAEINLNNYNTKR